MRDDGYGSGLPVIPAQKYQRGLAQASPQQQQCEQDRDPIDQGRDPCFRIFNLGLGVREPGVEISNWGTHLYDQSVEPVRLGGDRGAPRVELSAFV